MGMGHGYCGGGYCSRTAVIGYGLNIWNDGSNDIFDVNKLDESYLVDGDIDFQAFFKELSVKSKNLICIDTFNDSGGMALLMPAVMPWELNQSIAGITENEIQQEIVDLVRPHIKVPDEVVLQNIYYTDTCEFDEQADYGSEVRGIRGYGLQIEPDDIDIFTSKDTEGNLSDIDDILEEVSNDSGIIEYESNFFDDPIRLLLFKARMPWEYDEYTKKLTRSKIEDDILEACSVYLNSENDISEDLRGRMDDIDVCFYEGK